MKKPTPPFIIISTSILLLESTLKRIEQEEGFVLGTASKAERVQNLLQGVSATSTQKVSIDQMSAKNDWRNEPPVKDVYSRAFRDPLQEEDVNRDIIETVQPIMAAFLMFPVRLIYRFSTVSNSSEKFAPYFFIRRSFVWSYSYLFWYIWILNIYFFIIRFNPNWRKWNAWKLTLFP